MELTETVRVEFPPVLDGEYLEQGLQAQRLGHPSMVAQKETLAAQ